MQVKSELLRALIDSGDKYLSGTALADKLNVSRNAVWKAVRSLEADGYMIDSVTAKGYRLSKDNNHLSPEIISANLSTRSLGRELLVFDEIDSTNLKAKELSSQGALHGLTIVADRQTQGRGRLGRSFVSPAEKGLYMSVLLRPDFKLEDVGMITSRAACAVAEAVESVAGCDVQIKWVNDIYLGGRKICGILTEASFNMEMKALDMVVVGIGINIRSTGDCFDDELRRRATSIEDETGIKADRNKLCARVLNNLEMYLSNIESRAFLDEYRRRELLTGHIITANVGGSEIIGKAIGIDQNANLIIKLADGQIKHLGSGEANLCRLADTAYEQ